MTRKFFVGLVAMTSVLATSFSTSARETERTYHAQSVQSENGPLGGIHRFRDFHLLGTDANGYQIWGRTLWVDDFGHTMWHIDGHEKGVSADVDRFELNTTYSLDDTYDTNSHRRVYVDYQYTHFIRVKSQTSADYVCWLQTDDINSNEVRYWSQNWYLDGDVEYSLTQPIYFPDTDDFRVWLEWNIPDLTDEAIDYVEFVARYDGEDRDSYTHQIFTTSSLSGKQFIRMGNSTTTGAMVKAIVHLKTIYAPLMGVLSFNQLPEYCELQTCDTDFRVTSMRDNFEPSNGTYTAELEWTSPEVYTGYVDQIEVDYSIDEGNTWKQGISGNGYKATDTGKIQTILAGYHKYIFRFQGYHRNGSDPATLYAEKYDTIEINYDPQIARFELVGSLTDNYNETANTFKPTIAYTLNRDLYETSADKSIIEYSIDGGKYVEATRFIPDSDGTQQILLPATGKTYQFRLTVTAISEGKWTSFSTESPVYQRFTGVDSISADDNTPVDIYTIDGKLVAKQIAPADAKAKLANGTYLIGGKKVVINK